MAARTTNPVEHYLSRDGLELHSEQTLDLVNNEIIIRQDLGESPSRDEYITRFPDLADSIDRMFDVHQVVEEAVAVESFDQADSTTYESASTFRHKETRPPSGLQQVPGYEMIRQIGRGATGTVILARQHGTDRLVAIKVLHIDCSDSEHALSRFNVEAQAAARLRHPAIVTVYEAGSHQNLHYLVMEFVDGEPLSSRLQRGRMQPTEAARTIRDVAMGVAYAHGNHVIHRDLKPHNILLDQAGRPQIADFGLARMVDHSNQRTTTGEILGTVQYMSPGAGTRGLRSNRSPY